MALGTPHPNLDWALPKEKPEEGEEGREVPAVGWLLAAPAFQICPHSARLRGPLGL